MTNRENKSKKPAQSLAERLAPLSIAKIAAMTDEELAALRRLPTSTRKR